MNPRATTEDTEHTDKKPGLFGGNGTLLLGPWFLILFLSAVASAAEFRVGFAAADITPPSGWRRAGNYTELISTGVNDPLMAKAMVLQH